MHFGAFPRSNNRYYGVNVELRLIMDNKRVKAILFDLDNTLIETSRAGEVAIKKVMESRTTTPVMTTAVCVTRIGVKC